MRPQRLEISATEAKNQFGRILEKAILGGTVVITKHDAPKAVLISIDEFQAGTQARQSELSALNVEFDRLLAKMQTPGARERMSEAFHAEPTDQGKAAVVAARKRA